jgi:hypothetical protein
MLRKSKFGMDRRAKSTPDFVKPSFGLLVNFELWGEGGEDSVLILLSRSGVYFANTCTATGRPDLPEEHPWKLSEQAYVFKGAS